MADQTSGQAQAQTDDQQQVGNGGVQAGTQGPATQSEHPHDPSAPPPLLTT